MNLFRNIQTVFLGVLCLVFWSACSAPNYEQQLTNGSGKKWGLTERKLTDEESDGIGLWGLYATMSKLDKILEFSLQNHEVKQWYSMYPITDKTLQNFDFSTPPEFTGTWKLDKNKIKLIPLYQGKQPLSVSWEIEVQDAEHLTLRVFDEKPEAWMTEKYTAME